MKSKDQQKTQNELIKRIRVLQSITTEQGNLIQKQSQLIKLYKMRLEKITDDMFRLSYN